MGNGGGVVAEARSVHGRPCEDQRSHCRRWRLSRSGGAEGMPSIRYDAIIVGGGHNGLVDRRLSGAKRRPHSARARTPRLARRLRGHRRALARLPRLNRRVSLEPAAGAHCAPTSNSSASATTSSAKDPPFFSPFPDGRYFFIGRTARARSTRSRSSPGATPSGYAAYEEHIERLAVIVEGLLLTTPPEFPPRRIGDFLD